MNRLPCYRPKHEHQDQKSSLHRHSAFQPIITFHRQTTYDQKPPEKISDCRFFRRTVEVGLDTRILCNFTYLCSVLPLVRHFPFGLSLEPIQAQNRPIITTPPPCLARADFLTFSPSSSPSKPRCEPGTGSTGAFSSGQCWIGADLLPEEPRFPLFDPLQSHLT